MIETVSETVASRTISFPKILHQIYFFDGDEARIMPAHLLAKLDLVRKANPEWECRVYGLAEMRSFIADRYPPAVLKAFNSIRVGYGAAKADLFRYLVMYEIGGVYLDVKFDLSVSLDVLADDGRFLLTHWDNAPGEAHEGWGLLAHSPLSRGEYMQNVIVSSPGSRILKTMIDDTLDRIARYSLFKDGVGQKAVLSITGPIGYSKAVLRSGLLDQCRLVDPITKLGLTYPTGIAEIEQQRRSLFGHNYKASWKPLIRHGAVSDSFAVPAAGVMRLMRKSRELIFAGLRSIKR